MIPISAQIDIDRVVEDVFAFVADCRNNPQWQSAADVQVQRAAAPGLAGTLFRETVRLGARRYAVTGEVTALEPARRLTCRYSSEGLSGEVVYTFEPVMFGMRLSVSGGWTLAGQGRVAEWLAGRPLRAQGEAELERLKRLLESEPAAPGT